MYATMYATMNATEKRRAEQAFETGWVDASNSQPANPMRHGIDDKLRATFYYAGWQHGENDWKNVPTD